MLKFAIIRIIHLDNFDQSGRMNEEKLNCCCVCVFRKMKVNVNLLLMERRRRDTIER